MEKIKPFGNAQFKSKDTSRHGEDQTLWKCSVQVEGHKQTMDKMDPRQSSVQLLQFTTSGVPTEAKPCLHTNSTDIVMRLVCKQYPLSLLIKTSEI